MRIKNYLTSALLVLLIAGYVEASDIITYSTQPVINVLCLIYNSLLRIAGLVAIVILAYSGFRWVFAQEDAKERKAAKENIKFVFIGLLIILVTQGMITAIVGPEKSYECAVEGSIKEVKLPQCNSENCNGVVCNGKYQMCLITGPGECKCINCRDDDCNGECCSLTPSESGEPQYCKPSPHPPSSPCYCSYNSPRCS